MRIAQQARLDPFLDLAAAAAHLHGVAGDLAGIAAAAQLEQCRQATAQRLALLLAGIAPVQRPVGEKAHTQLLLSPQHHLAYLPPPPRTFEHARPATPPSPRPSDPPL